MEIVRPVESVVVNTAPGGATSQARDLLRDVTGVLSVTADPVRSQLVVCFDPTRTQSAEIRERLTPLPKAQSRRVQRVLMQVLRILSCLSAP